MKYKFPVDIIINCDSPEEAKVLLEGFMLHATSKFRRQFFVVDYDIPFYPYEEND